MLIERHDGYRLAHGAYDGQGPVRCCYEAGPCGFELQRYLRAQDVRCEVIAPTLIPRRPGDRIKTDRRDAKQLAVLYRAGALTPIHVPTEAEEAASLAALKPEGERVSKRELDTPGTHDLMPKRVCRTLKWVLPEY